MHIPKLILWIIIETTIKVLKGVIDAVDEKVKKRKEVKKNGSD